MARFTSANLVLCVERSAMRGVSETPRVSGLPTCPPWLVGACNRLGRPVAVIDVGLLAGLAVGSCPPRRVVFVDTAAGPLGLCAEGLIEERDIRRPAHTGEVLVRADGDAWFVDLGELPAHIESVLEDSRLETESSS